MFPSDLVWGAATASFQIEGSLEADGRGASIWDMMSRWSGKIAHGHTPDVASDHYRRYLEDVQLMQSIGLNAYRLSISWSRVLPEGKGKVNEKGLDFYERLIDALLEADITPWVTLFHWDYPYTLHMEGGWLNPASPSWFADYTRVVVDRLSDRVTHWITLNEPQVFISAGYRDGSHPPSFQLDDPELLQVAHNVLLAHGRSVQVIRAHADKTPQVGISLVGFAGVPASDSPQDIEATRRYIFDLEGPRFKNTWFSEPIYNGHYPEDGLRHFGDAVPPIKAADMEIIAQPLDYYAMNLYSGKTIRAPQVSGDAGTVNSGDPTAQGTNMFGEQAGLITRTFEIVPKPPGFPKSAMGWPITPEVMYWTPKFFYEKYQLPIVITENGISNPDWVHVDGQVHDAQRVDFLTRYLREYARAYQEDIDIRGYFAWTLNDNFEWNLGYDPRFGLIYVDYATQQRILKDSAHWYKKIIETNGTVLRDVQT